MFVSLLVLNRMMLAIFAQRPEKVKIANLESRRD
jgi:hypothetical protein